MIVEQMHEKRDANLAKLSDAKLFKEFSYINGQWCAAEDGKAIDVYNPGTGEWIGAVPSISAEESLAAVTAAQDAFVKWSRLLPQQRAEILRRWFELQVEHKEDLAILMTLEQGKPISECRGEIDYGASFIEFYAEEAKRPDVMGVTSHLPNAEMEVWLEPVGVAALITPWNFPNAMITRKAAAALAVGCSVVVHPSQETPFSALALAELGERAGFPPGLFNVVTGHAPTIVKPWTEDSKVRALSFTGSTEIGRLLYQQCAGTIKRLSLELGGHAPFILFDDVDVDYAVEEAIGAKFATSGQDCLGANRFYVHRAVYDEFCEKFAAKAQELSIGIGLEDKDMGPLMNQSAVNKQKEQVEDAIKKGAKVLCGGDVISDKGPLFFAPTVLKDVPDQALILSEETFGPLAAITVFDDEGEVIQKANDTEYGLMAYLHTKDPSRIYRMSRELQFGMVGVNRTKVTGAPIPFGGMKQSGLGREGSRAGLEAFADLKYVCRDWT